MLAYSEKDAGRSIDEVRDDTETMIPSASCNATFWTRESLVHLLADSAAGRLYRRS